MMLRPTQVGPILLSIGLLVTFSCFVHRSHAQAITVDDFNDCQDDGWTHAEWEGSNGIWDPTFVHADSCAYRLAAGNGTGTLVSAFQQGPEDGLFNNGFLRGVVRAETPETTILLAMRTQSPLGGAYLGHLRVREQELRISVPLGSGRVVRKDFEIAANEDWFLELGAVGDQISLKAWRVGEAEPLSAQLTLTDRSFASGALTLGAGVSEGSPAFGGGVFDDLVFFATDCNRDGAVDIQDLNCASSERHRDLGNGILNDNGLFAGDLNGDSKVDFSDFLILSGNFGQAGQYTDGDVDFNSTVDFGDFLILSENFGKTAAPALRSVPEPTRCLDAVSVLVIVLFRHRTRKRSRPCGIVAVLR